MSLERCQPEHETSIASRIVAQAAAICLSAQSHDAPQIILVRSHRTGWWGLPKGGIEAGEASPRAAGREAFEEAGVIGIVCARPVGRFTYEKDGGCNHYDVAVHVLLNERLADHYPEEGIRERGCFSLAAAIELVVHPQVSRILAELLNEYHPY